MSRWFRKLLRAPEPDDFLVGDWAHGPNGVGIVESVTGDNVVIAYDRDKRDILPFAGLRRCGPAGESLDKRTRK